MSKDAAAGDAAQPEAQGARPVPARDQIDPAYKWRLSDIFADTAAWEQAFREVEALLELAPQHQERATGSAAALADCLAWMEEVGKRMANVYTYAMLAHDQDTSDATNQGLYERANTLRNRVGEALAFIRPAVLALGKERVDAFMQEQPRLHSYRQWLDNILRLAAHVRSPEVEQLLAQAAELADVPMHVFSMLTDADLTFPEVTDEQGNAYALSNARYIDLLKRPDRTLRQRAYEAYMGTYGSVKNTLAASLAGAVKANVLEARARKYPSALDAALHEEPVDRAVYDNLIATVRAHLAPLHRYHDLRRRRLGLERLRPYDLYVPIVPAATLTLTYPEARDLVREALAPLGDEYGRVLAKALGEGWIDVYENRGKRAGAYSMGAAYGVHPYILMNWQDHLEHAFTLAHELGHALHSYFSQAAQPYIYANYTIFVAEVASTVNEGLLVRHLLAKLEDPVERAAVLNHYIDDFRATVFTQVMFAEFEQRIHAAAEQGQPLTAAFLGETFAGLCRDYWGPAVELDPLAGNGWARIPHFYMGFYVYKYATGFAAALALVDRMLAEGAPAVERYLAFLKSGSSDYPLALLKRAGVDLMQPEPIATALRRFAALVDELARVTATLDRGG